jgi:hypothetical protein
VIHELWVLLERLSNFLKSLPFWAVFVLTLAVVLFVSVLARKRLRVSTVTISLPFGLGNISYETTAQDRLLAWKLYVHLKTRKAALPFDKENDVIAEVYDSIYELFGITRDLMCGIPLKAPRNPGNIADLMLRVQNDGLRPHLTRWQAPFRRWWATALDAPENRTKSPQEIQRSFPKYEDLVRDLGQMNVEMSKYAEDLLQIARPTKASIWSGLSRKLRHHKASALPPSESVQQVPELLSEPLFPPTP